ncbi:MAG: hypothetical protein IIA62_07090 [Nitrospinae bacterium]|nr:hypothetical protein [Nitrospinota bacterium]
MLNEENPRGPDDTGDQEVPGKKAASEEEVPPGSAEEIDLNRIFPEVETNLNALFPDQEMKRLLKKVQKNKKDLTALRERFEEGI